MDPVIAIGKQAPDFKLHDLYGIVHTLKDQLGTLVVLNFWSAECDWCERVDRELVDYVGQWQGRAEVWWIASNTCEPPDAIARVAADRKLPTVLMDTEQHVANLYGAHTTPHFFVVDTTGKLAYQGAWNDVTFRQRVATQVYVPRVLSSLMDGRRPEITETPPYGCALVQSFTETH